MSGFRAQLAEQRWDDHRFYHHSLVNQSLHFVSACTFIVAYLIVWIDPAVASLLAWGVAMTSRQAGHFFFEPKDYDQVNQATHQHKEDIKIGYNLARKWVLMGCWMSVPVGLLLTPTLFGTIQRPDGVVPYLRHVGIGWLFLGIGAIAFRSVQLFFIRDVETGLVWATKIMTDPFSDFRLYSRSPAKLIRSRRVGTEAEIF